MVEVSLNITKTLTMLQSLWLDSALSQVVFRDLMTVASLLLLSPLLKLYYGWLWISLVKSDYLYMLLIIERVLMIAYIYMRRPLNSKDYMIL